MKILRIILAITVIALSTYGFITGNVGEVVPYVLLSAGLMFILIGITEFQKRKGDALNLFIISGFVLFVAVYSLL